MFKNNRGCSESSMNTAATYDGVDMNMSMDYNYASMGMPNCCPMDPCMPTMCPPVYECPQERVCHRTINYEVPHMIPCHTRMINHHVYHHSYTPCYSYSEEDEYSNVYGNRCC